LLNITESDFEISYAYKKKTKKHAHNISTSDVARPLSFFQDQDHFFKTAFFKDHQIINPRSQKTFLYRKNQANHAGIMPVTENKPAYYRRSSKVLLPKLGS